MFTSRLERLQDELDEAGIAAAVITDDDSVYYFSGYYDYLHMEFGRPTILVVFPDSDPTLITPAMESEMAQAACVAEDLATWSDGVGEEWRGPLRDALPDHGLIAIEPDRMPPIERSFLDAQVERDRLVDVTRFVSAIRMVKSDEELQIARHAGQVAMAMMAAGRDALDDGVPEYEVALATNIAGTRAAAALLEEHYDDPRMSPNTHFLQIMASGPDLPMVHHRASTRRMRRGEPVFLCFCGMTNFHRFKLGHDRTFWIGEMADPSQAPVYETTIASQDAALDVLRAGVTAESVHAAYADVIRDAGYEYPFRAGRATGFSYLEWPQLVFGDETILEPGMVLAVDGSVSIPGRFRAQVGDSVIVTEDGYEPVTWLSKDLDDVVLER